MYELTYRRPASLDEALALLSEDGMASVISGGQTLMPVLRARLAMPSQLVDIARLDELRGFRVEGDTLVIGAGETLQADKQILQTNFEKTRVRAPFSGKVGLRNISLGAYINPQTTITTIRQVNPLKLDFSVPEKYGSILKVGTKVQFTIEDDNKNYTATILATENNIAVDSRSLRVKARVNQSNPKLIAGTFVKVNCNLGKNNAAIMIPSQAVIPKSRNKEVLVYSGGFAKIQIVKTGARDSSMVEITSGLNVGDTILTTGLLSVKLGATIKLNKIKN